MAATLATFGVIGAVLWIELRPAPIGLPPVRENSAEERAVVGEPSAVREAAIEQGELQEASQLVSFFLESASIADRLQFCRFPSEVGERMRRFYEDRPGPYIREQFFRLESSRPVGKKVFLKLSAKTHEGKDAWIVLERVARGRFLVDWDSHVRFSDLLWDGFVASREPEPKRFQVMVERFDGGSPHYPFEYYTTFLAYWDEPGDGVPLFVRRGTRPERELLELTSPDAERDPIEPAAERRGAGPATMDLRFNPEANREGEPPALELVRYHHRGWVDVRTSGVSERE